MKALQKMHEMIEIHNREQKILRQEVQQLTIRKLQLFYTYMYMYG